MIKGGPAIPAVAISDARTGSIGLGTYRAFNAADTVGVIAKASPGMVMGWQVTNTNAATRFLKLYDKATAPATNGADTPLLTIALPASSTVTFSLPAGLDFTVGISHRVTTLVADNDATAPTANDVLIQLLFR